MQYCGENGAGIERACVTEEDSTAMGEDQTCASEAGVLTRSGGEDESSENDNIMGEQNEDTSDVSSSIIARV